MPRKAIRYTEQTRPDAGKQAAAVKADVAELSYRDLQKRAVELGISGKQTADELRTQIAEAESA